MAATVLLYNFTGERGRKIALCCLPLGIRPKQVGQEDYGEPVGALAGLFPKTGAPAPAEGFSQEMLVMAGFTQSQLDQFLHSLRKKGGGPVALKAVVTPANQGWDSVTLFREILQEHQAFEDGRQAKT